MTLARTRPDPPTTAEAPAAHSSWQPVRSTRWAIVWLLGLLMVAVGVAWAMDTGIGAGWLAGIQAVVAFALGAAMAAAVFRERLSRASAASALRSPRNTPPPGRVDTVAGGIAHDINNLMAVIQVNRDLLEAKLEEQQLADPQQIRRILERIQRAINRGEALIRRMLGVVELDHLDDEELSAEELVLATIDLIRPALPAHIRIVTESLDAQSFWGDRAQLEQVLFNLMSNAIHAIGKEPGEIRVSASERPPDHVVMTVADSGCGIATEALERIFEPYFTTKPTGVGTGLGLAQVQRIITQHSGKIDLHSRVGQGTTINVALPITRPESRELMKDRGRHEHGLDRIRGPRVLLIEDEDDIAEVIVAALPAAEIHRFRTAEPALRAITRTRAPYDLLLLDLNLPDGSGRSVFRSARKKWPNAPILVITGYVDSEELAALLAEPGTRCLRKPFSLRELRSAAELMIGFVTPRDDANKNSQLGHR